MTVVEFYSMIEGDYEGVKERMMSDQMIIHFLHKFEKDKTYEKLAKAIEDKDIKQSFEWAHTLKGLVGNFGFTKLYEATCNLVEQLRSQTGIADEQLANHVTEQYIQVIDGIRELD